jgi:hypothetical protein
MNKYKFVFTLNNAKQIMGKFPNEYYSGTASWGVAEVGPCGGYFGS